MRDTKVKRYYVLLSDLAATPRCLVVAFGFFPSFCTFYYNKVFTWPQIYFTALLTELVEIISSKL